MALQPPNVQIYKHTSLPAEPFVKCRYANKVTTRTNQRRTVKLAWVGKNLGLLKVFKSSLSDLQVSVSAEVEKIIRKFLFRLVEDLC